jgi:tetratricopeptide (TPR) repeat protein
MRKTFATPLLALLLLSGCASIAAGDEVKDLQEATSTFADALKAADAESGDAYRSSLREEYRIDVFRGGKAEFNLGCLKGADDALKQIRDSIAASPYDSVAADRAYAGLGIVRPCDIDAITEGRLPSAVTPGSPLKLGPEMGTGSDTLSGTARKLEAYTKALADVATGETAAKTDEARSRLVTAGKGLLGAVKIEGADPFVDVAVSVLNSLIAAKRNAATREFLDRMDPYMPTMMERVGLAARLAHANAARDRALSANAIAGWANERLNGASLGSQARKRFMTSAERFELYDETLPRLAVHNDAFVKLATSDPMASARAFAQAHQALTALYHDPKASRKAIFEGLADFQEAAAALYEALKDTPGGTEAG